MTNSRRYGGVAAMVALLMLCAFGAAARRRLELHRGSGIPGWAAVLALLVAVLAASLVIVLMAGSRRRMGRPARRSLLFTAAAVLVLLLVVGILVIVSHAGPLPSSTGGGLAPPTATAGPSAATSHHEASGTSAVLLALVVLCAVAGVGVLVARRRPGPPPVPERRVDPEAESVADLEHALRQAATALLDGDDPRAAIIAAYEQMQRAAQDRGLVRGPTDTPAEFLARAAHSGTVDREAAARLTGLFERARFSHRPITPADRTAAQEALADLRAGWARR